MGFLDQKAGRKREESDKSDEKRPELGRLYAAFMGFQASGLYIVLWLTSGLSGTI